MIELFLAFLNEKRISFRVTNGSDEILASKKKNSDYDILFQKKDFLIINEIVTEFSNRKGFQIVQVYHQGRYAKNFFVYDTVSHEVLNLDLYGELSRQGIRILKEEEVFASELKYNSISILRPEQEFIQYLVKKLDKGSISKPTFLKLKLLFDKEDIVCADFLAFFFRSTGIELIEIFKASNYRLFHDNMGRFKKDFCKNSKTAKEPIFYNLWRIGKRICNPTGISIAFLGPDGSGKSTVIDLLKKRELPFRRTDYFHLKPILQDKNAVQQLVSDPHHGKPYSKGKSYGKLTYFIYQYNWGWLKNIAWLKRRSSLVIFDRYFDDMLVDYKRYRYGGSASIAKFFRYLIPRPALYFILTAESEIIYKRKQEVTPNELQRQIKGYRSLVDNKRYIGIDVARSPEMIANEIMNTIMKKMNERY